MPVSDTKFARELFGKFSKEGGRLHPRSPWMSDSEALDLLQFDLEMTAEAGRAQSARWQAYQSVVALCDFLKRVGIDGSLTAPLAELGGALKELEDGVSPQMLRPKVVPKRRGPGEADSREARRKGFIASIYELCFRIRSIEGSASASKQAVADTVEYLNESDRWSECGGGPVSERSVREARAWVKRQKRGSAARAIYDEAVVRSTKTSAPAHVVGAMLANLEKLVGSGV